MTSHKHYLIYGLITFLFCGGYFSSLKLHAQRENPDHIKKQTLIIDSLTIKQLESKAWKYYYANQFDSMALLGKIIWEKGDNILLSGMDSTGMEYRLFGKGLYGQGRCMLGYFDEGLPLFENALSEMEAYFGPHLRLSYTYVGLGIAYNRFGDKRKNLWAQQQASRLVELSVKKGESNYYLLGNTYNNLGYAYFQLGQIEKSIKLYYKALKLYKDHYPEAPQKVIDKHLDLSKVYQRIENYELAKQHLDTAEFLLTVMPESASKNIVEIIYYSVFGKYFESQHNREKAKQNYQKALSIAQRFARLHPDFYIPPASVISGVYHDMAKINSKLGLYKEGEEAINRSIDAWMSFNSQQMEIWKELILTKAEIIAGQEDWSSALQLLQTVLDSYKPVTGTGRTDASSFQQFPMTPQILKTLTLMAKIRFEAYQSGETMISSKEVLNACSRGQQYLERMIKCYVSAEDIGALFEENKEVYEIPVKLAFASYQEEQNPTYLDTLFYLSEKTKAFQLLSSLQGRGLQMKMGLPNDWVQKELEAQKNLFLYEHLLSKQLISEKEDSALIIHYQELLKDYRVELDAITAKIQKNYPAYYKLKYDVQPIALKAAQRSLNEDALHVQYYWGKEEIYVLGLCKKRSMAWTVPVNDKFEETLQQLIKFTQNPPSKITTNSIRTFAEKGYYLYQQLLAPALDSFPQKELIIIPDGSLSYLPWPALSTTLPDEPASYRKLPYLIKSFQLHQEYSATLLQQSFPRLAHQYRYQGYAPSYFGKEWTESRGMDTLQIKWLFPDVYRGDLPKLEKAKLEVEQVKNMFKKSRVFLEGAATEQAFKENYLKGRIHHFAMHSFTNDIDPMLSHLAFSKPRDTLEDGNLYAYEIYNMNITADLAVLSACSTGDGTYLQGQGVMSLARAFKYAGVQDVLMSLWRADDEAAYLIMFDFFKNLKQKKNKGWALQQATQQYLNHHKNDHDLHPYYWAGFALIGPGAPLEQNGTSQNWRMIIVLIFLISCLYFFLGRNRRTKM